MITEPPSPRCPPHQTDITQKERLQNTNSRLEVSIKSLPLRAQGSLSKRRRVQKWELMEDIRRTRFLHQLSRAHMNSQKLKLWTRAQTQFSTRSSWVCISAFGLLWMGLPIAWTSGSLIPVYAPGLIFYCPVRCPTSKWWFCFILLYLFWCVLLFSWKPVLF